MATWRDYLKEPVSEGTCCKAFTLISTFIAFAAFGMVLYSAGYKRASEDQNSAKD